jgi:hypothetical protein
MKVELPRGQARLDALADVKPGRHEIEGVEHDCRAADRPEKLAPELFPFAVEEGAADRLRFAGQDVAKQSERRTDARMPAQHVAREVVVKRERAAIEIFLGERSARIDGYAPERERLPSAFGFGGGVLYRRAISAVRRVAAAVCNGQAEPLAHVIAAGTPIIAREGMAHESVWRCRRQADAEASVLRAVTGAGAENLLSAGLAAE